MGLNSYMVIFLLFSSLMSFGDAYGRQFESYEGHLHLLNNERAEGGKYERMRILLGPGSKPPHCKNKCHGCTPCVPVAVGTPPKHRINDQYYPEHWMCSCGGKTYPQSK